MLTEVFYLHEKGSLADARLCTYILDDSDSIAIEKRPMMLICPGGGYEHTSDREAEPLAMHFLSIGYHVAVLRYSVAPAVYPTALLEATASMKLIHEHAKEWYVDTDKIVVQGSSAGGHLAACLSMFWHTKWLAEMAGVTNDILKPAAMLLLNENATVTICHSRTKNLEKVTSQADILVAAVGRAKMIKENFVNEGAVVIDVGINVDENGNLCGDVDTASVQDKVSMITPVPAGVGSVTTSILAKHVVKACKNQNNK